MKRALITISLMALFFSAKAQMPTVQQPVADPQTVYGPQRMVYGSGDTVSVYVAVQQQPEPKGGMKGFYQYLMTNIHYPHDSRNNGIQGKVFVSFIVEENGSISHIRIVKKVSEDIDAEAVRLLSKCPKWKPGMQDGKPVKVLYTIPISFVNNAVRRF